MVKVVEETKGLTNIEYARALIRTSCPWNIFRNQRVRIDGAVY